MKVYQDQEFIESRYQVIGQPMKGGMGLVYMCIDHFKDCPVALKTFKPEFLSDRASRERMLREGNIWVNLGTHTHIVRCYQVDYVDPAIYLVLEWISSEQGFNGSSLKERIIPGVGLGLEPTLLYGLQIARGMKYACERVAGFVHRDLKPENILIGADRIPGTTVNRLRITDFGLARAFTDYSGPGFQEETNFALSNPSLTQGVVGTWHYMAPEQWKRKEVGVYTDVYALGCILYEMLSGEHLVKGNNIKDLMIEHCREKKNMRLSSYPIQIQNLVECCLAVDPTNRYGSWGQIENEIQHIYQESFNKEAPVTEYKTTQKREEQVAEGWSYISIGSSYRDIGKSMISIGFYKKALDKAETLKDRALEGAATGNLGLAYADLNETQKAINYYQQALKIDKETGDHDGEGTTLSNLGITYTIIGEYQTAIKCYEQALFIHQKTGNKNGERTDINNLGNLYRNLGQFQKAIGCFEHCLSIARMVGDRRGEGYALGNLANTYADLGKTLDQNYYLESIYYFEQRLSIAHDLGDQRGEADTFGAMGTAYADLEKIHHAIDYYERAYAINREIRRRIGEADNLSNLGGAYDKLGDFPLAVECLKKSLSIYHEIGDKYREGEVLGNLGIVYTKIDEINQAIGCYEQAIVIQRKIEDSNGVAENLYNIAQNYALKNDIKEAISFAQEAINLWHLIGNQDNITEASNFINELKKWG